MDGWTDEWTDGWTDRLTDGRTVGWTDIFDPTMLLRCGDAFKVSYGG